MSHAMLVLAVYCQPVWDHPDSATGAAFRCNPLLVATLA